MKDDQLYNFWCHIFQNQVVYHPVRDPYYICIYYIYYISYVSEIARNECGKYGKTSCNVFNQKIDYAPAEVSTRYGILGVKVWISYSKKKKGRAISETYEI